MGFDFPLNESDLVHKSGTETVTGKKTFDEPIVANGGFEDADVTPAIKVGDSSNTSLETTNKTLAGGINELKAFIDFLRGIGAFTDATNPALNSITQTDIDDYVGIVITTTTTGNDQTLPAPTGPRKIWTVVNNDTSTDPINIIGASTKAVAPGIMAFFVWDESAWITAGTATAPVWGAITGTLSNQTDLQSALNAKTDSPVSGVPSTAGGDQLVAVDWATKKILLRTNIRAIDGAGGLRGIGNLENNSPSKAWVLHQASVLRGTSNGTTTGTIRWELRGLADPNDPGFRLLAAAVEVIEANETQVDVGVDMAVAGVIKESMRVIITNVVAANGITAIANQSLVIQSSTAGDASITANPQIVGGTNGQSVEFVGNDNTKTVTFNDGLGLHMQGGVSFTLGRGDVLGFRRYAGTWIERYRSNNS